jgi:hypothetical protein
VLSRGYWFSDVDIHADISGEKLLSALNSVRDIAILITRKRQPLVSTSSKLFVVSVVNRFRALQAGVSS